MEPSRSYLTTLFALAFAALCLTGCADDAVGATGDEVGGACDRNGDCFTDSMCLTEDDQITPIDGGTPPTRDGFFAGTCTVTCGSDMRCPEQSECVNVTEDEMGTTISVCLLPCEDELDCRPGYGCVRLSSPTLAGGVAKVCAGPAEGT